ncbi:class I tRNA ligase family protein, partial [Candidatus Peregrinibacteria bacterium]|nr:class I tRNA ligase family protein [Candidatus Peregrinibacteria bacterium]
KTYFHWIENLRDWCISRQIWWGHRVPVWYRGSEECAGVRPPEGSGWEQDPDTLDTWFSSALWTWSTLVDPQCTEDYSLTLKEILEKSPDYQKFHPTQVMETGYDIIFFWVARMILMTTYATGQIPFDTVYLHGLIRSRDGRKMSKSDPDTMIDPLEMIAKYGADALRLSMIVGQSPGADSRLYEEKIAGYRNFVNKLWNASRFVLMQCEEAKIDPKTIMSLPDMSTLSLADRAMLSREQAIIAKVTKGLSEYRLSETGEALYSYVWDDYCDWYLELSKGNANVAVLVHTLRKILVLAHPYCPFVTEELWAQLQPGDADLLIKTPWPELKKQRSDAESEAQFLALISVIQSIRKLRADQGIEPGLQVTVTLLTKKSCALLESEQEHIRRMAKVESLMISNDLKAAKPKNAAVAVLPDIEVYLHLEGLIDVEREREKLTKEKASLEGFMKTINAKLGNAKFVENAKPEVVAQEREKLANAEEKLRKIEERLQSL